MMRQAAENWTWASTIMPDERHYAVVRWKTGAFYAGPVEAALSFPPSLLDEASMQYCTRAEALRFAVDSKVRA
jgi:hypothetical protein